MTSTRPAIPPTNLKERIAALEQRNNGSNANSRATSPAPGAAPTVPGGAHATNALRDRIAKFEKKGRVPVPRGSFGLGAPPTSDGPRRQGELYGNRIPAPSRALSAQYTGGGLTAQYTGGMLSTQYTGGSRAPSPIGSAGESSRRSFTTSIVMGDFDEGFPYYSPMSSPILGPTSDSPESPTSSPEPSPLTADVLTYKRAPTRGTSFHEALEFARKTEAAKLLAATSSIKKKSTDSIEGDDKLIQPQTPPKSTVETSDDAAGNTTVDQVSSEQPIQTLHESPGQQVKALATAEAALPDTSSSLAQTSATAELPASHVGNDGNSQCEVILPKVPALTIRKRAPSEPVVDNATPISVSAIPDTNIHETKTAPVVTTEKGKQEVKKGETVVPKQSRVDSNANHKVIEDLPVNGGHRTVLTHEHPKTPTIVVDEPVVAAKSKVARPGDKSKMSEPSQSIPSAMAPGTVNAHPESLTEGSSPDVRAGDDSSSDNDQVTVPRVKPTIQPPDPSSFLSPPPTAFRSARTSSGGSSLASLTSDGSRPQSMIEISRALRMTPATGRGVPVFLPPGAHQPRKSDFVYFPPSPDGVPVTATDEDSNDAVSGHQRRGSLPDMKAASATSTTFKAVVHRKVKETPASASFSVNRHFMPETPDKRATILQHPLSPGHGELATLLQESMLLEDTLMSGKLPGESPAKESAAAKKEREVAKAKEEARLKEEELLRNSSAQLRAKRDMPVQGRLKHTFLMPLSKARAMQKKEAMAKTPEPVPRSSREDSPVSAQSENRPSQQVQSDEKVASHTSTSSTLPKSSKPSRFPSFKRFGSISMLGTSPEVAVRQSNSTPSEISSEDSNLVVTPPDNPLEFGAMTPTKEGSRHAQDVSFSFPSLSPKKSGASVGRAASFAEKMWSRGRTKSNGSVLSSNSAFTQRSTEELAPQLPVLDHSPALELPPKLASTLQPPSDKGVTGPSRSSSLRHHTDTRPAPHTAGLTATPQATPESKSETRFLDFNSSSGPSSPISISSLPSPLFDKDIFDAFPSVPGSTPTPSTTGRYMPRRGEQSLTAAAAATADFDSALLSSAIHLAARSNATSTTSTTVPR